MNELEAKLGHTFRRRELLEHALTHSSWSNERGSGRLGSNERLARKNPGSLIAGVPASEISAMFAPAFRRSTISALVSCSLNL